MVLDSAAVSFASTELSRVGKVASAEFYVTKFLLLVVQEKTKFGNSARSYICLIWTDKFLIRKVSVCLLSFKAFSLRLEAIFYFILAKAYFLLLAGAESAHTCFQTGHYTPCSCSKRQ